jgi:hypothetical protein
MYDRAVDLPLLVEPIIQIEFEALGDNFKVNGFVGI